MCALVSYQMGLGGAKAYFGTQYNGKRLVEVDRNTHWYFKKFLAHKIAFENQIGTLVSENSQQLIEIKVQGPATLSALAKKYGVSESHLKEYNTWAKNEKIPSDRTYSLVFIKTAGLPIQQAIQPTPSKTTPSQSSSKSSPVYKQANSYPRVAGNTTKASEPNQIKVNDLSGVQATNATSPSRFSEKIGLKEKKFRRLNDLDENDGIEAGKYYYTEKKKSKAEVAVHIVQPGETLWTISQKYGVKLSSLKAKNRIRKDSDLAVGMVLNLQDARKRGEVIEIVKDTPPVSLPKSDVAEANTRMEAEVDQKSKPANPSQSPKTVTHTVSSGETLFAISRKYGVSVEELKTWNGIGAQNIISIGQKLVIYQP